jgi:small subunit ribosomal protein S2
MDGEDMAVTTLKKLLEAGVHFGHQTRRWNPKMRRFIFAEKKGIYIIDLQKTLQQLEKAFREISGSVANGGKILFVGTKKQVQDVVQEEAERCGMFYVTNRWLGGMLTNFQTIKKNIDRLKEFEEMQKEGSFEHLTKKEALMLEREMKKLDFVLGGIKEMKTLPDIVYIVDAKKEKIAINEARKLSIPIVAIVDTNTDPEPISIPVAGNDDAIRSVRLISSVIADAVLEGKAILDKKRGVVSEETGPSVGAEMEAAPMAEETSAESPVAEPDTESTDVSDDTHDGKDMDEKAIRRGRNGANHDN